MTQDPKVLHKIHASVETLHEYLSKGYAIYGRTALPIDTVTLTDHISGVNTGFGGSADTRTSDAFRLQQSLLQLTQAGILTSHDFTPRVADEYLGSHAMPVAWVRATMVVRCNHILRGHSGVRLDIIEAMLKLLREGFTPIVPLRGSISASGDLMPLSYLVAVLEGNPDVKVHWDRKPEARIVSTTTALELTGLTPFIFGPKEGLGMINGAASSAAVGSLAAHEASQLMVLAQALTGLTCEAMMGNAENYHDFPAQVRPHPGQIEVAANIRKGLENTEMAETSSGKGRFRPGLVQDRYALRGASQWLGPVVEDLELAIQQLTIELNATQDNPVIDSDSGEVYFCSNFQAASVSRAMEKIREGLQMVGKLLFTYSSELINPDLNKGLPPNLAADNPSLSFTMKGVDISMASYLSELGFLANSVTSHVQSAEMHNQSINSLALISARYALQAAELVSMMSAALLYVVCQAVDLRILHETFLTSLEDAVQVIMSITLTSAEPHVVHELQSELTKALRASWNGSSRDDLSLRLSKLSTATAPVMLAYAKKLNVEDPIRTIEEIQKRICQEAGTLFETLRQRTFSGEFNAEASLGAGSRPLYQFVRRELNVPFHCGVVEHPTIDEAEPGVPRRARKTIGSWISIIYEAIRDGRIRGALSGVLQSNGRAM